MSVFICYTELVRCVENTFSNGSETQENEPGITVLYTGFGPFRDHVVNASWEAVSRIPERGIALPPNIKPQTPVKLVAYYLPVVYQLVADVVPKLWAKHQPDVRSHPSTGKIKMAHVSSYYVFSFCSWLYMWVYPASPKQ